MSLPQALDLTPTGFINDYAGVLSARAKGGLESLAVELKQKTGAEVAVAIVPTIGDDTIENYANLLAEKWGVGDSEDRGALILIAVEDRKLRIEVGYGLEPIIPDGRAGEIRDAMTPHLRASDYDAATVVAVTQVAGIVAQAAGVTLTGQVEQPAQRSRRGSWWPLLLMMLLFLLPRRRRRGGWGDGAVTTAWMLGGFGRGGFGGGSGGSGGSSSGGFGGFGGGGFGGGGASGSW
ncbi:MAG: TPM domain-containing protein [Acidobacteria bacterium]|nr:TPM domain-containing protein [Acidobacteriota bacterium]